MSTIDSGHLEVGYGGSVLQRLPDHKINRIDEIIPWNWQAENA